MSIDAKINDAIKSVVSECKPNIYTGTAKEYCVYTYDEIPELFAESTANAKRYSINVNLYMPHGANPNAKKKAIATALKQAGFTYPEITNASDSDGQHYSFDCEVTDGEI